MKSGNGVQSTLNGAYTATNTCVIGMAESWRFVRSASFLSQWWGEDKGLQGINSTRVESEISRITCLLDTTRM
jgi:hypothetical protein